MSQLRDVCNIVRARIASRCPTLLRSMLCLSSQPKLYTIPGTGGLVFALSHQEIKSVHLKLCQQCCPAPSVSNPIGLAGAHCLQNLSAFFWVDDIISVQESLSLLADFAGFVFGG